VRDRIKWERRLEPAHAVTAGWDAVLDGEYVGTVWLDGSYSLDSVPVDCGGSHAIAAELFLIRLESGL
jgi:hypothetical protein